ncbi:hypothetical protein CVT24_005490 [Panaeolus cyanescens]|uniref:Uncharacterized protein n=1 Tax=Panaeolus cyanescens TaxID=181874 RepID=A0A409YC71_9AGAR|nr:hypothetical protein CVT24_005490 [Panaeolus cyanescens]
MEEEQTRLRGFPEIAIQHWIEVLIKGGHDRKVVQEMNTELVCSFDKSVRRVGTFVDLNNPKIHDPENFVKHLENHAVPVWYRWLPDYAQDEFLCRMGPTLAQIQELMSQTVQMHVRHAGNAEEEGSSDSMETEAGQGHRTLPPLKKGGVQAVLDFLKRREVENLRKEEIETPEDKSKRMNRLRQPPVQSARVYVWVEKEGGVWDRDTVSVDERRDTLADMRPYQKKYDSFHNEWNCCYDLPRPIDYEGDSSDDEEEGGYDAIGGDMPEEEAMYRGREENSNSGVEARFELSIEDMDDLAAMHNGSSSALTTDADAAEDYVMRAMRVYYGYTTPLPLTAVQTKTMELRTQNRFLKFVGIPLTRVDRSLFNKPTIIHAVDFMERLGSNGKVHSGEYDAREDHRESLTGNRRVRMIRKLKDRETGKEYYVFDEGNSGTTTWMLAVRTATHALIVCRLPDDMTILEVATYLVEHGIPFHTLQKAATLTRKRSVPRSTRLLPYRTKDHVFTGEDYEVYMTAVENALGEKRQARAALMSGGFVWRMAKTMCNSDVVLEGPSGLSDNADDNLIVKDVETGEVYIDDGITTLEEELLCGVMECFTGNGNQTSRRSFYPLPKTFTGSGMDYGRWTVILEDVFKAVREATISGERKPKSMGEWRDGTRGAGEFRRAMARIEEMSRNFIDKQIP